MSRLIFHHHMFKAEVLTYCTSCAVVSSAAFIMHFSQVRPVSHYLSTASTFARRPFTNLRAQRPQRALSQRQQPYCDQTSHKSEEGRAVHPLLSCSAALWLLSELPACAEQADFSQGSFSKESYYVTLGLFLLSLPGMRRPPHVTVSSLQVTLAKVCPVTSVGHA